MHFLIEAFGWRNSLLWLIAITLLIVPLAWPISGKPQQQVQAAGAPPAQNWR